jgi:hypothetical protein
MAIVCSVIAARLHLFQTVPFDSEAYYFLNYLIRKEVVSGLFPTEKLPIGNTVCNTSVYVSKAYISLLVESCVVKYIF